MTLGPTPSRSAGAPARAPRPPAAALTLRATPHRVILDSAHLLAGGVTAMALLTWLTGVWSVLTLNALIVGIPSVILTAEAFRVAADRDRCGAALALGSPLCTTYRGRPDLGLRAGVRTVVLDPQTWRDRQWLVAHSVIGSAFACAAGILISSVVRLITLPPCPDRRPRLGDWARRRRALTLLAAPRVAARAANHPTEVADGSRPATGKNAPQTADHPLP